MKRLIVAAIFAALSVVPASAQKVWTGGESGAYYNLAGKPVVDVMTKLKFKGYEARPSGGTLDNIDRVIASIPHGGQDLGIAQSDEWYRQVQANPDKMKQLTIIRPLFCEGLWIVSAQKDLDFGKVLAYGRRLSITVAAGGTQPTWHTLQSLDGKDEKGRSLGLARITKVEVAKDGTDMINRVASGQTDLGFMVQFFYPSNPNTKLITDNKLNVIPVLSREARDYKIGEQQPYTTGTYDLTTGFFSGKRLTTMCTQAVLFGVNPDSIKNPDEQENQRDRLQALGTSSKLVTEADFLPKDGAAAKLMKFTTNALGKGFDEAFAAAMKAKEKIEESMQ